MISDKRLRRIMDVVFDPPSRTAHVHCDAPAIAVLTLPTDPPQRMRVCMKHRRLYNKIAKHRGLELPVETFVGGPCEFATLSVGVEMKREGE
jgi:hypothetical protein